MAKKQTRRSISVSRTTYERLKSFCETNGISMSQFVESRVGDFLGEGAVPDGGSTVTLARVERPERPVAPPRPAPAPRPSIAPSPPKSSTLGSSPAPQPVRPSVTPMTSAAARYAIEPPLPIIKKADQPTPKSPVMPKADQIFTF